MVSPFLQSSFLDDGDLSYRRILENLPIAVYATDGTGRIVFFNKPAELLWGRAPVLGEDLWCGSWRLSWPDGTAMAHDECPMATSLKSGQPLRAVDAFVIRPDGSYRAITANIELLYDGEGKMVGALNMLMELGGNHQNGDAAPRLAAIVESSSDAIISKNLAGIIRSWNKGAEKLFGYAAEEVIGKSVTLLIPANRADEEVGILQRIQKGEPVEHYETIRQRKDGSLVEIELTVSPVKNSQGKIIGASKIARDISDRKRGEKTKDLLMHEIRHRVRNTLGVAQALASQTLRSATDNERNAFVARLHALSSAHDLLAIEQASAAPILRIVERVVGPFMSEDEKRIQSNGPDALLDWSKAMQLALVIHELATNAVKFGALSTEQGRVDMTWNWMPDYTSPRRLKFLWRELGGPKVKGPERHGFGSKLIERALDADGEVTRLVFAPAGVICNLEISV